MACTCGHSALRAGAIQQIAECTCTQGAAWGGHCTGTAHIYTPGFPLITGINFIQAGASFLGTPLTQSIFRSVPSGHAAAAPQKAAGMAVGHWAHKPKAIGRTNRRPLGAGLADATAPPSPI